MGRNGSGKTTLLKIIVGLLKAHQSQVLVNGVNPWRIGAKERQNLGYQSEKQLLPSQKRVAALIRFCSDLYPNWDHQLVNDLLGRFQINPKQRIHQLSAGNQRLVAFILAIAPRPDLLVLDEPAANLDVIARRELLNEMLDLVRQIGGKTVLFSTHILTDVERIADHVGILSAGRLVVDSPLDELKEQVVQIRLHSFTNGSPPSSLPNALHYRRQSDEAMAIMMNQSEELLEEIQSTQQCQLETQPLPLEDLFIHISQANHPVQQPSAGKTPHLSRI